MRRRIQAVWSTSGVTGVAEAARRRLFAPASDAWKIAKVQLAGKRGLEIGGPSSIFARGGILPLYPVVASLDNCDFSGATTVGRIEEGRNFFYDRAHEPGLQRVRDAVDLFGIPSGSFDFLLASHVLEHVANPLRALEEWTRVLNAAGVMVLVVPHKEGTFDHRRPVTTLNHLIDDYVNGTEEDDLTHLQESLALHDFARDPKLTNSCELATRCADNVNHRWLHHHVFNTRLVGQMIDRAGLQICSLEALKPHHIVVVAVKATPVNNSRLLADARSYRRSPFAGDHVSS
jgi:SAM-dependent methyltransferase